MSILTGCGVGAYTVTSGKADEGYLSFTSQTKRSMDLQVYVDGRGYNVESVKTKDFKPVRDIKQTSKNTITVAPGTHEVSVVYRGREIFAKTLYISVQEHKIIDL